MEPHGFDHIGMNVIGLFFACLLIPLTVRFCWVMLLGELRFYTPTHKIVKFDIGSLFKLKFYLNCSVPISFWFVVIHKTWAFDWAFTYEVGGGVGQT